MRAVRSALAAVVVAACLLPTRAAALAVPAPDVEGEVPRGGGVSAAVLVRQDGQPATAAAPTTVAMPESSGYAPEPPSQAIVFEAPSFSSLGSAQDPCLRRRWGGNLCINDPSPPDRRDRRGARRSPEEVARVLADRAIELAPDPRIEVAPAHTGLTGLESYFWTDRPAALRAVASAGGVRVVAEARPLQYVWSFGDGGGEVSSEPGVPWRPGRPGSIPHTYEADGAYELRLAVIWDARWRVSGGAWQDLGYFSTAASRSYPVRQVVAFLVPAR